MNRSFDPDKVFSSSAKMKLNFLMAASIIACWTVSYFSWGGLLVGLIAYATIGKIGGDIAMHRYFSHRTFTTDKFWDRVLKACSVMIGHGSMFLWAITHRAHHKESDTHLDPHPPNIAGLASIFFRTWSSEFTPSAKYGKDLMKDHEIMFIHRNYFKLFYLWLIVLSAFGFEALLFIFAFPCFGVFLETSLVNTVCHRYGRRDYATDDNSTNNVIVNIITLGNGMHNTHHKHQGLYTTDLGKAHQFDPMKYFIHAIRS